MGNPFNEALISYIRNHVPKNDVVNILMDTLCIGKEAAYRRMRGEVIFTLDEAAKISYQLGISLDNIIGIYHNKKAVFDVQLFNNESIHIFMNSYCTTIKEYIQVFNKIENIKKSKAILAYNSLPFVLYTPYSHILKFRLFRWIHQSVSLQTPVFYSTINLSKELLTTQTKYAQNLETLASTHIILDKNTFTSFIIEIEYFYKLNLITDEELLSLKKELKQMLEDMEELARIGKNKKGNEVLIYISNINFEACYSYYEFEQFQVSHMRVFSINSISYQDPKVCEAQKEWIESLKRYAVLISQSGEIQRIEFFKSQYEHVENLGKKKS
ncbi:hypothetical protein O2K51_13275 [Apibacter raozihei]|uniref:hypothetical protein n=1 Tax=Apibacter raozihei TaxID=2500547 RepID=UPI000FE31832|nr:hypothetical protein [Apibacter raozihei]